MTSGPGYTVNWWTQVSAGIEEWGWNESCVDCQPFSAGRLRHADEEAQSFRYRAQTKTFLDAQAGH